MDIMPPEPNGQQDKTPLCVDLSAAFRSLRFILDRARSRIAQYQPFSAACKRSITYTLIHCAVALIFRPRLLKSRIKLLTNSALFSYRLYQASIPTHPYNIAVTKQTCALRPRP